MSEPSAPTLVERKRELRRAARQRRAEAASAPEAGRAGEAVRDRFPAAVALPAGCAVSAYWPMGDELDPRPLFERLRARGHPICLPVVVGRDRALVFRAWQSGDTLEPACFGTRVPAPACAELRPRVLLVPLLAFDRAGYRLGYGGGFYDRTLAALRAAGDTLAVGLAYAAQEVPGVPHGDRDQPLDWVVTDAEAIEIVR